jgi:hypothetical protein
MDGAAGMPAHVTLLYPLPPVAELDAEIVREVAAATEPFRFEFHRVREWPDGVEYLGPEPGEPFARLTGLLMQRFPEHPPYGGIHDEVVPHLTVVHTDDHRARADAVASVAGQLPLYCEATEIWLMHEVNGRWQRHTPFALG